MKSSPRRASYRARYAAGTLALSLLIGAIAAAPVAAQAGRPVAIVVHPETRVENLSFSALQRIFRGEQQFWGDRSRVTLLVRAPTAFERKVVLDRIYGMNEDRFRQYWIAKMFKAEVAAGPKLVYSTDMAINLIAAIPGAITFIPATALVPGIKVVRVDGKLPTDPDYPLR